MTRLLSRVKRAVHAFRMEPDPFPEDAWTDPSYPAWLEQHRASSDELEAQRRSKQHDDVSFSIIVPLYRTPLAYLSDLVGSVLAQTHGGFELILVNGSADDSALAEALQSCMERDRRIKTVALEKNLGIAGNTAAGLEVATGSHVLLLDHDDMIEPDALFEYAQAIQEHPDAAFYYCDEDLFEAVDGNGFVYKNPLFKPDFSRSLLACKNYILHMLCFRRADLQERGFPGSDYDGAQDFKLIIDGLESGAAPHHIPKVLYHWRVSPASTATNPDSKPYGKIAYQRCLEEIMCADWDSARIVGTDTPNLFDPWWAHARPAVKVSVIVDAASEGDAAGFLQRFNGVNSFPDYELIFVGSQSDGVSISGHCASWVQAPADARLFERLNAGAREAQGTHLLFLDACCSFQTAEPLDQLACMVDRPWIGVVAPKVLYADQTIKSYGVAVTSERIMPLYRGFPGDWTGYQCNLRAFQESSACGWQGAIISRSLFEEVGGFDGRFVGETGMADLCHRVSLTGLCTAEMCTVVLAASDERPADRYDGARNAPDFSADDLRLFDEKWPGARVAGDPYFNPNLDQSSSYFQLPAVR